MSSTVKNYRDGWEGLGAFSRFFLRAEFLETGEEVGEGHQAFQDRAKPVSCYHGDAALKKKNDRLQLKRESRDVAQGEAFVEAPVNTLVQLYALVHEVCLPYIWQDWKFKSR